MIAPRAVVTAALEYVKRHPDEIVHAARNAAGLRFGIPIVALQWLAGQAKGKKAPKDIAVGSAPPALKLSATIDAMGLPVRAGATIRIDEIAIAKDSIRVGVRLRDVSLTALGEADTPVYTLIKSGALDLSKPGNLLKYLPKRPAMILEAEGDRVVVDLLKIPQLANNVRLRRALEVLAPVLGVRAIETDRDHLYVVLEARPRRLGEAVSAARAK